MEPNWIEIEPESRTVRLPDPGRRCLFSLRGGTVINGREVRDEWRVFGYRSDEFNVFVPLFNCTIPIMCVHYWGYVLGPDYWNGHLRSKFEFLEA